MSEEVKIYELLTKDDQLFKTTLESANEVRTKEYNLEVLEAAEKRVLKGTNKTLQAALNSISQLKTKSGFGKKDVKMDEYGLNDTLYKPEQIKFIKSVIEDYHDHNDITTTFQKQSVIRLGKLLCTINELEAQLAKSNGKDKDVMKNLKDAQEMYGKISDQMKLTPKQATDGMKGEDVFANACIEYENRFKDDEFNFENVKEKETLATLITDKATDIVEFMNDSKTFFEFRKRLTEGTDFEPKQIENVGLFTIEEFFDLLKVKQDRDLINEKNELTFDDNFVDQENKEV